MLALSSVGLPLTQNYAPLPYQKASHKSFLRGDMRHNQPKISWRISPLETGFQIYRPNLTKQKSRFPVPESGFVLFRTKGN